jgi:hypothetical protein
VERWLAEPSGLPYEPFLPTGDDVHRLRETFAETGVAIIGPPALDPGLHEAIVAEARVERAVSAWTLHGQRGVPGSLAQDTVRAQLGPLARELAAAGATRALLHTLTGRTVVPGWSATCLTFYDRAGMHLGAHRDKEDACQYAILLYLEAEWPPGSEAGPGLQLHIMDPTDEHVAMRVTARPNRAIVLHGARLTHFRPALDEGERLSMLNACYSVVG